MREPRGRRAGIGSVGFLGRYTGRKRNRVSECQRNNFRLISRLLGQSGRRQVVRDLWSIS